MKKTNQPAARAVPSIPTQETFSADELRTVLRFLRKRVVISGSVRMESAEADMSSMILTVKAAQHIERLAQQELDSLPQ